MIYILSGPTCSGKTTIGKRSKLPELISHTSRDMREGEVHGETYYFVTKDDISKMEKVEFTEYGGGILHTIKNFLKKHNMYGFANMINDSGSNYYCLSKKEVERKLDKYKDVFVIMDKVGIEIMREKYKEEVVVIYIDVPIKQLVKRVFKRDGFIKGINRLFHMYTTNERDNEYIADFVIDNSDGHLKYAVQTFKNIILGNRVEDYKDIFRTDYMRL